MTFAPFTGRLRAAGIAALGAVLFVFILTGAGCGGTGGGSTASQEPSANAPAGPGSGPSSPSTTPPTASLNPASGTITYALGGQVWDINVATGEQTARFDGGRPYRAKNGEVLIRAQHPDGGYDLAIVGTDGITRTTVKGGCSETARGVLSAEGSKVAYLEGSSPLYEPELQGAPDLYTIVRTREGSLITAFKGLEPEDWSPDGRLLMTGYATRGTQGIYLTDAALRLTGRIDRMPDYEPSGQAQVSPDGRRIAYKWNHHVWVMNFDGGDARQVTQSNRDESFPAWSPDGKWLAVQHNPETSSTDYIYLVSPDETTAEPKLLLQQPGSSFISANGRMSWR